MLIDAFAENWISELHVRAKKLEPLHRLYLLVDGVFVPGLHRLLREDAKAILFESLPGCTEETKDVSPFLTPFDSADKTLTLLLRRCNRWPMISVIETPEFISQQSDRLAAWCVVEADGQRFNLRFPDTRRLPGIFQTLNATQRAQIAGPAVRWSYVSRDGRWRELEMEGLGTEDRADQVLDQSQFAMLVNDSRTDELLMFLSDRGLATYRHPSKSHALLTIALRAADDAQLANDDMVEWCEWFWKNDQLLHHDSEVVSMLDTWRKVPL
jgi:hypothetical protein